MADKPATTEVKRSHYLPDFGVSVEATSAVEAVEAAKKQAKQAKSEESK